MVANGTDPASTPCVDDAAVVASETRERDTQLQFIYSQACHAAWARIARYDDASAGNTVSTSIYRQIASEATDRQDDRARRPERLHHPDCPGDDTDTAVRDRGDHPGRRADRTRSSALYVDHPPDPLS